MSRPRRKLAFDLARGIIQDFAPQGCVDGKRLPPIKEFANQYNVGFASMREAFRILDTFGMVDSRTGPNGGIWLRTPDDDDFRTAIGLPLFMQGSTVREVVEARIEIEQIVCRLASKQPADRIRTVLEDEPKSSPPENDSSSWPVHASDFHRKLALVADNSVIGFLARALRTIYMDRVKDVKFDARERARVVREHEEITQAVLAGDGERAAQVQAEHLRATNSYLKRRFPHILKDGVEWK